MSDRLAITSGKAVSTLFDNGFNHSQAIKVLDLLPEPIAGYYYADDLPLSVDTWRTSRAAMVHS